MERLYTCVYNLEFLLQSASNGAAAENIIKLLLSYKKEFCNAMDDDLNTALAISVLFDMVRDINGTISAQDTKDTIIAAIDIIKELGGVLGLLQTLKVNSLDIEIENLIENRQQARKDKDFALADEIRDKLKLQGIILEDTPSGVKWRKE